MFAGGDAAGRGGAGEADARGGGGAAGAAAPAAAGAARAGGGAPGADGARGGAEEAQAHAGMKLIDILGLGPVCIMTYRFINLLFLTSGIRDAHSAGGKLPRRDAVPGGAAPAAAAPARRAFDPSAAHSRQPR